MFEDLSKSNAADMTEKQYVEALKAQFEKITTVDVVIREETEKVSLGETKFLRAIADTTANGIEIQQVFYLRKFDEKMCVITVSLSDENDLSEIEAMFR